MSDYSKPLGDAVKNARVKLDLSQNEVADRAGIDVRTVINIEKYRGNPKMQILYPLVRTLKMNSWEIFFSEIHRDTPALSHLRLLVEDCSEEEADKLIPVFEAVLSAMRSSEATKIE